MWVEPFFKTHIVVIFMFLHSSSPDSSTKSTTLKSNFKLRPEAIMKLCITADDESSEGNLYQVLLNVSSLQRASNSPVRKSSPSPTL